MLYGRQNGIVYSVSLDWIYWKGFYQDEKGIQINKEQIIQESIEEHIANYKEV